MPVLSTQVSEGPSFLRGTGDKLDELRTPADFDIKPRSESDTDQSQKWQALIDANLQSPLVGVQGIWRMEQPLSFTPGANFTLHGQGIRQFGGARFDLFDTPFMEVDGGASQAAFNLEFKNFLIWPQTVTSDFSHVMKFNNCYRVFLEEIGFNNVPVKEREAGFYDNILHVTGTIREFIGARLSPISAGNETSGNCVLLEHTKGKVTLRDLDTENNFTGVRIASAGHTQLYNYYSERNGTALWV